MKRETDKAGKAERTISDLKDKNTDLQKELDDLVNANQGRNGVVSSCPKTRGTRKLILVHQSPTKNSELSKANSRASSLV